MTSPQRATANRLLTGKGQPVTHSHAGSSTYNPSTGQTTQTGDFTQNSYATIFPFGAGLRKMENTTVTADDQQCFLSALKDDETAMTAPVVGDTLTDANGTVYTITEVSELAPAGLTIMFELTIRSNG